MTAPDYRLHGEGEHLMDVGSLNNLDGDLERDRGEENV
jgi:hypothetical protein